MKKVLFIQHASAFGGSVMSLLYTMKEIKKQAGDKYEPIVALAKWTNQLADFYKDAGFEVVKPKRIDTYEHTQALSYNLFNPAGIFEELLQIGKIKKAKKHTHTLIDRVKPDIIHLNSVVLLGSALAAKSNQVPLLWHVREHSANGLFGVRKSIIKKLLESLADKTIFISNSDKASWNNPSNSTVIYNFVNFNRFDADISTPSTVEGVPVPKSGFNVLFLGGVSRIKGGIYLIKALKRLHKKYPNREINLLFAGGLYKKPDYFIYRMARKIFPLFGLGTYSQKIERQIEDSDYQQNFIKLPFVKNVPFLFAACDVVVFPAIRPHFARPVIEAGAMRKPVIASDISGVRELIHNGENGLLAQPKSINDLVQKLEFLMQNPEKRKDMGEHGYKLAKQKFTAKKNVADLLDIYNKV